MADGIGTTGTGSREAVIPPPGMGCYPIPTSISIASLAQHPAPLPQLACWLRRAPPVLGEQREIVSLDSTASQRPSVNQNRSECLVATRTQASRAFARVTTCSPSGFIDAEVRRNIRRRIPKGRLYRRGLAATGSACLEVRLSEGVAIRDMPVVMMLSWQMFPFV